MKKTTIVPEIINSQEIRIVDENNVPVNLCRKSQFKFNYNKFKMPYIIIDNIERRKYKDVEIRKIDVDALEKFGLRIVSLKTTRKTRNRPKQNKSYLLERIKNPIPNSEILTNIPKEHLIELDVINKRIRLKGKNVYPYRRSLNATPWIEVIEK